MGGPKGVLGMEMIPVEYKQFADLEAVRNWATNLVQAQCVFKLKEGATGCRPPFPIVVLVHYASLGLIFLVMAFPSGYTATRNRHNLT